MGLREMIEQLMPGATEKVRGIRGARNALISSTDRVTVDLPIAYAADLAELIEAGAHGARPQQSDFLAFDRLRIQIKTALAGSGAGRQWLEAVQPPESMAMIATLMPGPAKAETKAATLGDEFEFTTGNGEEPTTAVGQSTFRKGYGARQRGERRDTQCRLRIEEKRTDWLAGWDACDAEIRRKTELAHTGAAS